MDKKAINKISELRKIKKLSQRDLASVLHCGVSTVAMWETGKRKPNLNKAKEIAEVFNKTIEEIFFCN